MFTRATFLPLISASLLAITMAGCEPAAVSVAKAPIAEWPERNLTFVRGSLPNQVRTLRTDHGQIVLLGEMRLRGGVTITGLSMDKAQSTLRVQTAQGSLDLPVLADGRVLDPRTAVAEVREGREM